MYNVQGTDYGVGVTVIIEDVPRLSSV